MGDIVQLILPSRHIVDCLHVGSCKRLELTTDALIVATALACHLRYLVVSNVTTNELLDVYRHADGMVESLHSLDATQGGAFWVGEVVRNAHNVHGKANETREVLVHNIACPAGPYLHRG